MGATRERFIADKVRTTPFLGREIAASGEFEFRGKQKGHYCGENIRNKWLRGLKGRATPTTGKVTMERRRARPCPRRGFDVETTATLLGPLRCPGHKIDIDVCSEAWLAQHVHLDHAREKDMLLWAVLLTPVSAASD